MQFKIVVAWIALSFITFFYVVQPKAENGQLERDEYEHLHFANFKEFFNHVLNVTQVLTSMDVKSYSNCAFECLINMACFSFNFASSPNNNTGLHVCHLLATDKYNHSSNFEQSDHFHHYAIGSPCESFPCQNGGTCHPLYEQNDYRCECLDGINGTHCEKDPAPNLEPLGCYRDTAYDRALPVLYANVRSQINWTNMELTVNQCARLAHDIGYEYFAVQYYGICYGGRNAGNSYAKHGNSTYCWVFDKQIGLAVGRESSNFVYRIK